MGGPKDCQFPKKGCNFTSCPLVGGRAQRLGECATADGDAGLGEAAAEGAVQSLAQGVGELLHRGKSF